MLNIKAISLTREEGKVRTLARTTVEAVCGGDLHAWPETESFPRELMAALKSAGFYNIGMSEDYGGKNASTLAITECLTYLAAICPSTASILNMHYSVMPLFKWAATPEQRAGAFKSTVEGKALLAAATSEKVSRGRVWHMDGYVEEREDGFAVTCSKSFVTGARDVDYFYIPARRSPTSAPRDIDLFLVRNGSAGIRYQGDWRAHGLRGTGSIPVEFDQVLTPKDHRFKGPGSGFALSGAFHLPYYLVGLAAVYQGIAEGAYKVVQQQLSGSSDASGASAYISDNHIQRTLGDMKSQLLAAKALLVRSARLVDASAPVFAELLSVDSLDSVIANNIDDDFFVDLLATKSFVCRTSNEVVEKAFSLCGGRAFRSGHKVEQLLRDVKAGSVMAPANPVADMMIGKQVLNIPQIWE